MELKISKNLLIACAGLSLLFFMMTFISQLYAIKIFLMCFILVLIKKKLCLSKNVIIAYVIIISYGLYGILVGLVYGTPNPFAFITIYCIYPLLYMLYSSALIKNKYFNLLVKTIFIAHIFIISYDLLFALGILLRIEIPNIYPLEIPFSIYNNSSRMNFVNLNTLTFTTPVLFILYLGKYELGFSRKVHLFVLLITFFLLIISGRRSVMLVMIALPFIPFIFSKMFSKTIRKVLKRSSAIFLITCLFLCFIINKYDSTFIDNYTQVFLNAFDSDKEPIKFAQQKMLIEKFIEKPIFGHGAGAMFYEPSPGRMSFGDQFELSYHFRLASSGIIGFTIIVGIYLWVLFYGLFISQKKNDLLLLSFLIGYFFMLIADATNPVLCSFDLIWPLYLCLARINYWELQKE